MKKSEWNPAHPRSSEKDISWPEHTLSRIILFTLLVPMVFSRNERLHQIMVFVFVATMVATLPENWTLSFDRERPS